MYHMVDAGRRPHPAGGFPASTPFRRSQSRPWLGLNFARSMPREPRKDSFRIVLGFNHLQPLNPEPD